MTGTRVPVDAMVAAALRLAAEHLEGPEDRARLLTVAQNIDTALHTDICPLCRESTCVYLCPLTESRRHAKQTRQGA
jgi:hypothetical protein